MSFDSELSICVPGHPKLHGKLMLNSIFSLHFYYRRSASSHVNFHARLPNCLKTGIVIDTEMSAHVSFFLII